MTLLSLKSLSRLRTHRPKTWHLALLATTLVAAGLIVADVDIRGLQAQHADLSATVDEQSADLADIRSQNAELRWRIDQIRPLIAVQEAVLSSTVGLLP